MNKNSARIPRPAPRLVSLSSSELKPASVPPPLPLRRVSGRMTVAVRRAKDDDVVEKLCEALASLDAEPDALSAARLCLDVLARAVPCRALLAHAFDVARGDFLVVHARGEHADAMVLERHPLGDPLLWVAMPTGEPFAWPDLRRAPVNKLARFKELPHVKTIMACPVVSGPRWLGAIELVDPLDGTLFRTEHALGARYVANRYARFLTAHGLIVDVGAVARFANSYFASSNVDGGRRLATG